MVPDCAGGWSQISRGEREPPRQLRRTAGDAELLHAELQGGALQPQAHRRAVRPGHDSLRVAGNNGDHVELGMNIVLPATLILDWWDERLRVAGSLKLGWVTASLVLANNRPSTLPPRRGTRPSGQLPQSGHQRGHGVEYRLIWPQPWSNSTRFPEECCPQVTRGKAAELLASPANSSDPSITAAVAWFSHDAKVAQ